MTSRRNNSNLPRRLSVIAIATVFAAAVSSTFLHFPPDRPLAGAEAPVALPRLSGKTWMDGSFSKSLEKWLLRVFGLRGWGIRIANQLDYSLFKTLPESRGTPITRGKDGWLYENAYIRYYEEQFPTGQEQVDRLAERLGAIRRYLRQEGIRIVVVIAPSKLEVYPDFLPEKIRKTGEGPSAREQILEALRREDVPTIDARERFLAWRASEGCPLLFHPYGTHWNAYGAQRILDELAAETGITPPLPHVTGYDEVPPFGADCDLMRLYNIPFYGRIPPSPSPRLSGGTDRSDRRLKALIVGDSFSFQLIDALGRTGRFSDARLLYYFRGIFDFTWEEGERPRHNPPAVHRTGMIRDHEPIDWIAELRQYDLVILEFNEIYARKAIWGFADFVMDDIPSSAGSGAVPQAATMNQTEDNSTPDKP